VLGVTALPLSFEYDDARQLLNAHDVSTSAFEFAYDFAGNRTSDYAHDQNTHNGVLHEYTVNSLNQLDTVTTTVNSLPPTQGTLSYDANGNMIADAAHKTYEWDAANRLVAINYTDTGNRTEFVCDGLGHRVKITEYGPGVTAVAQPVDAKYAAFVIGPFALPAGGCNLTLQGLNPNGGDNTMLVDSVTLNNAQVANGSFESPSVSDYQNDPPGPAWSYTGSAGVAAYGGVGTYTSHNPNTTAGTQVAFVRNSGLLSQNLSVSAGKYTLRFSAAQRGSDNDSYQQLRVNLRSSASIISAKTFVWCGNEICEERDGTGATVAKRFFADGEQRIGDSDAGNYYYSRDHLGSIREVTDSSGTLVSQYDYDAWGNSVVVSGKMNIDFGYTGHYFHAPSGLDLTLYRAYNPALGRWLSRDPIEETGGLNLYSYVADDPIGRWDELGLCCDERAINLGLAQLEISYRQAIQGVTQIIQKGNLETSCKQRNIQGILPRLNVPPCWECQPEHRTSTYFDRFIGAYGFHTTEWYDHWVIVCRGKNDQGIVVQTRVFDFWGGNTTSADYSDFTSRYPNPGCP
jgi:RHS repeat-associated protein